MVEFKYTPLTDNKEKFKSFFDKNRDDIELYFPDYDSEEGLFSEIQVLEIESEICGLFIYQSKGETIHIELDYVISKYRNLGIGKKHIPEMIAKFRSSGYKIIYAGTANSEHKEYLNSLGFKNSKNHSELFEIVI